MKTREHENYENNRLLSMLEEKGKLEEIIFIFTRPSQSGVTRFDVSRYLFSAESLGIYCLSDLVASKEDRHYGLPSTDQVYLFPCENFHAGIDALVGIVNNRLKHYPREGELYVFVNRLHNQMKIYYLSSNEDRIYQYRLAQGTYDLPRGFGKMTYEKINRTNLVHLLDCPKEVRKKNAKKKKQTLKIKL